MALAGYHTTLPSQSDVDFQDLNWKAYVSNLQQEETRNTPAGEMWGRALRLSAPTPQVYNITHSIGLRQPGAAGCRLGRGAKYWSPCSLKFTSTAARGSLGSRRAGWRKVLREHISIQLAALQLATAQKNGWLKHANQHKRK